jgi:hypothetical protein
MRKTICSLTIGSGASFTAYPIYSELKFKTQKESGEEYYRTTLSSALTFVSTDFEQIYNADIEDTIKISLAITENGSLVKGWSGKFYKTDCVFNVDNQTCEVTPETSDAYEALLSGIEKEYDLYKLKPALESVKYDKRSMLQVYVAGQDTISCMFQGQSWEQGCEAEDSDTEITNTYHFGKLFDKAFVEPSGASSLGLPEYAYGSYTIYGTTNIVSGVWTFTVQATGTNAYLYKAVKSDGKTWQKQVTLTLTPYDTEVEMAALTTTGATGTITMKVYIRTIFARLLCDAASFTSGGITYTCAELPSTDIGGDVKNFHYCLPYEWPSDIMLVNSLTTTPTNYYYNDGYYYASPSPSTGTWVAVAQSFWTKISWWFNADSYSAQMDKACRVEVICRDTYPLYSAINALCSEITKDSDFPIVFRGTSDFSEFLYGTSYVFSHNLRLFITQKTNILAGQYTQAAQKAPTTLRKILDMLRDCFQCYWWLENVGSETRLRIEHKMYFVYGGSYDGSPSVGLDLTKLKCLPIGESWAQGKNEVSYDKDELPGQYEFDWQDDTSAYFDGNPIAIKSKFVKSGEVESITISEFCTDLDYMLFNRSSISEDGFALLGCLQTGGEWKVAYTTSGDFTYQNGYLAFTKLVDCYMWSMPAEQIEVNGATSKANAVERKKKQTIDCPFTAELNPQKYVRTDIGDGVIDSVEYDMDNGICEIELLHETK